MPQTIVLDGGQMRTRDTAHEYLRARLHFPEHYGRNLDALFDLMSTYPHPVTLVICHRRELLAALGDYGICLLDAIDDAAWENPALTVVYDDRSEKQADIGI